MKRVHIPALTRREKEQIIDSANFNDDQLAIFNALNENKLCDIGIMMQLGLPNRKYYDTKYIVCTKVEKLAVEFGFTHVLRCK